MSHMTPTTDGLISLFTNMESCGIRLVSLPGGSPEIQVAETMKMIRKHWSFISDIELGRIQQALEENLKEAWAAY